MRFSASAAIRSAASTADRFEAPLARPGLDFVGLDPLGQNVGVDVQEHVEDVQRGSPESLDQFASVVLA